MTHNASILSIFPAELSCKVQLRLSPPIFHRRARKEPEPYPVLEQAGPWHG